MAPREIYSPLFPDPIPWSISYNVRWHIWEMGKFFFYSVKDATSKNSKSAETTMKHDEQFRSDPSNVTVGRNLLYRASTLVEAQWAPSSGSKLNMDHSMIVGHTASAAQMGSFIRHNQAKTFVATCISLRTALVLLNILYIGTTHTEISNYQAE